MRFQGHCQGRSPFVTKRKTIKPGFEIRLLQKKNKKTFVWLMGQDGHYVKRLAYPEGSEPENSAPSDVLRVTSDLMTVQSTLGNSMELGLDIVAGETN
jgi:hypothetical protein